MQLAVSPGFTSRPSLSVETRRRVARRRVGVAGIHVPAFVERAHRWSMLRLCSGVAGIHVPAFVERSPAERPPVVGQERVSPGFTSRPSLSGGDRVPVVQPADVSPGFTSRPSLSAAGGEEAGVEEPGVAGIHVPAFVERGWKPATGSCRCASVAGIHVPAFVERTPRSPRASPRGRVSPGFTSRPSLSAPVGATFLDGRRECRRDSRPGLR